MKKFVCVLLALMMTFALCVSAFAATEEVGGTLADGTAVTKPVSEVVKKVEDGLKELEEIDKDRAEKLREFFAKYDQDEKVTVITEGIVHFDGAFADVTEEEIEVPLPLPGAKIGDKYFVILSNDTTKEVEVVEDDAVTTPFPKDADYMGYVIIATEEETFDDGTTWTFVPSTDNTPSSDSPAVKG